MYEQVLLERCLKKVLAGKNFSHLRISAENCVAEKADDAECEKEKCAALNDRLHHLLG